MRPTASTAAYRRSIPAVHRPFHQNNRSLTAPSDARKGGVSHHLVAISPLATRSRAVRPLAAGRCSIAALRNVATRAAHPVYQHPTSRLATGTIS